MDVPSSRSVSHATPPELCRPSPLAALGRAASSGLGALIAPAGFGKTVLLSQYAHDREGLGLDVVRLTLRAEDRGHAAALRLLEVALFGSETGAGSSLARLVARLGTRRPVIMLDGADAPPSAVEALVGGLSLHVPDRLTLVVASREPTPSLASALARLRGARLGADELAFTGADGTALLAAASPDADPAELVALGDGWPLAVGLIAARLARGATPATMRRTLVADLAPVVERDILRRLPAALRRGLAVLAVPERFTLELAECVLPGQNRSAAAVLERLHPWVAATGDSKGWWRMHPLLAEVLRALDLDRGGALTKRVHLLASEWHEWRGDLDEAVATSAAASAHRRTAELIESAGAWRLSLYEGSERLRNWIGKLPEHELAVHPRLVVARAYLAMRDGKLDLSARLLSRAGEAAARSRDPELRSDLAAVSTLVTYLTEHSLSHLAPHLSNGIAFAGDGSPDRPLLQGTLRCAEADAALTLGMPGVAGACAEKAVAFMREAASRAGMAYAHMHAGYAKLQSGALGGAEWHFAIVARIAEELAEKEPVLAPISALAMQTVRLWRHGGAGRRDAFLAALQLVEAGYGWQEVFASAIEAGCTAFVAAQDREGLVVLAAVVRRIGTSETMRRLAEFGDILDLHVAAIDADVERCQVVAELLTARSPPRGWQRSPASWRIHVHSAYAYARFPSISRLPEALVLVDDAIRCCSANGIGLPSLLLRLSRAELLLRLGADAQGFTVLREVALAARSHGLAAPFAAPSAHRLLTRAAAAARRDGDEQYLEAIEFLASGRRASPLRPAVDLAAFSRREREVIAQMLAGACTKAAARALGVTEHTVKFHLAAIYRKLGVRTRGQAVSTLFRLTGGGGTPRPEN